VSILRTARSIVAFLAFGAVVGAGAPDCGAATEPERRARVEEYELKAVFLFNFARFVDWPAESFAAPASPLVIGILGEDPFGPGLDAVLANEDVGNRKLSVRRFASLDQLEPCHILFVSPSEAGRLDQVIARLGKRSTLTVGDTKEFTARSGMIGFETVHNRLRLRINLAAARAARLTISSQLLRQARIVETERAR